MTSDPSPVPAGLLHPCQAAMTDFFATRGITPPPMQAIDRVAGFFQKPA